MKFIKPIAIDDENLSNNFVLPKVLEFVSDIFHFPHLVTTTTLGQLENSSHNLDGTAFFGAGNSTAHYLHLFDHTNGNEFGLEDHYRTGDYVDPVLHTTPVSTGPHGYAPGLVTQEWVATMDKGLQNGLHNEQGSSATRSAAGVDISLNFGADKPHDGQFVLDINGHDLTLKHSGTGLATQWFFEDAAHNPIQGMTLSPDGHVLQDSMNLAFVSQYLQHNANPADLKAQDVHISLTEMVGAVGVAQLSETIHLV